MTSDERERIQVQPIVEQLGAAVWPPDWDQAGAEAGYLYRPGAVLVPETGAPEVLDRLGGLGVPAGRAARSGDLVRLEFAVRSAPDRPGVEEPGRRVPELLDQIDVDGDRDPAAARPDHVLYVCGHPCPADEPQVEPSEAEPTRRYRVDPVPAPRGDGAGQRVAVIDTGVDEGAVAAHQWTIGVTGEPDDGVSGGTISKYGGHGTFSAGCLRTVAPMADVWVAHSLPRGIAADYESQVAAAIDRALDRGEVDVLLVCFASRTYRDRGLPTFDDLRRRRGPEMSRTAVLAPAGNDGWTHPMFPAAYPWVTSVGALDEDCQHPAAFSNSGDWVDVWAPGTDLVNAFVVGAYTCDEPDAAGQVRNFDGMARWSGTSFATPLVAGMVAARASADAVQAPAAVGRLLKEARREQAVGATDPVRLIPG